MRCLMLVGAVAGVLGTQALTVERMYRDAGNKVVAELAFDAGDADRNVVVAWGASDAGGSYASWSRAEFAQDCGAGADATTCRVGLPPEVANAAWAKFFLVPASAAPGYLRSTGRQVVVTDFYPDQKSKIVADYQWEDVTTVQQRLFGVNQGLKVHHYINGSTGLSWSYSDAGNWTPLDNTKFIADTSRATITLDARGDRVTFVKNGATVFDKGMKASNSTSPGTRAATAPLLIFATDFNVDKYGAARLYSLSCYADGVLRRNLVPALHGGIAGLRDTVGGAFHENALAEPFWAGAPAPAVAASDSSDAVDVAAELAKLTVTSASAGGARLSFGASAVPREIWCAWDDSDKGETFGAWAHNEFVRPLSAGETTAGCPLPPGAIGAKAVRFFVLSAGGTYPCAYIRSDGRQAIETGILVGNRLSVRVDLVPRCLDVVQQRVFGVNDWTNSFVQAAYINGSGQWAWSAKDHIGSWTGTGVNPLQKLTTITLDVPNDLYSIAVEGRTVYTRSIASAVPAASRTVATGRLTLPILSGKDTANRYVLTMQAELYGAEVREHGTAVRQLTPCVVNGEAGMRDAVSGDFLGNAITNGYTRFFPGGRTDAPTALASAAVDPSAVSDDVFADAKFWMRGLAADANGDGVLNRGTNFGEVRDALRRTSFDERTYGVDGALPVFTNEFVRMPGRGVGRWMDTLYFPQTVKILDAAKGTGVVHASTISLPGTLNGMTNRWSFVLRAKPDLASAPANGTQWLVKFGHGGGRGFMMGFSGSDAHTRKLAAYSSGQNLVIEGMTITNGWFDLAVVADGQRLTVALMRDGDELTGTDGDRQLGTLVKTLMLEPKLNLSPNNVLYLGAEEVSSGPRVYPMGANDNCVKAFRGSIQQFAVWDRALSTAEIYQALGWPRTDLWRVGVVDGRADEFRGTAPAGGVDVDAGAWPIQEGVSRGQPLTLRFPLVDNYETRRAQLFRWKSLPGSASGMLELTLNGKNLGRKPVRGGRWSQWFVPAEALQAGTNTAVLARVDTGEGALRADAVMLGGGFQVGKADGGYSDYVQESTGLKHLYAADGNLHDVRRVLYCGANAHSNYWFHVNVPAEMAHDRQRWRFTLASCGGSRPAGVTTHPISVDLNGTCLGTKEMGSSTSWTIDIPASDILPGENVFNFRNGAPNTGSHYTGIDYFALEPLRPTDGTIMLLR